MKACLRRIQVIAAQAIAVFAVLAAACTDASTPSPLSVTELPTTVAIPTPTRPPFASPATVAADPVFIQLTDPLDEPEYYCVDVPGAGRGVSLNAPLQAHTCKTLATAADELFTIDHPNEGQILMQAYDLCVEADGAKHGSSLRLHPCSDSPLQRFAVDGDFIRLNSGAQDGLCMVVAAGSGIPTGGPSHLRRDLTLEECETMEPELGRWIIGLFDY